MSDHPLVSFSIVSWNVREQLWKCLTSIDRFVTEPHEIIVIDNDSHDASAEVVQRDFPHVRLIANATNRGFAAAQNQGLGLAKGDYVMVLNPDCEFINNPVTQLVSYLQQHPTCAVVGPEILNADRSHQQSVRRFPTLGDQVITLLKLRHALSRTATMRNYRRDPGAGQSEPVSVDQIMGAAMLFPKAALQRLGGFDEGYWIWFEEVDWCQRAHRAGLDVVYFPGSQIIHLGGQSFGQVLSWSKQRWFNRSLARYAGKYWSASSRFVLRLVMPFNMALSALQTLVIRY